jgi:hypothetical protein
MPQATIRFHKIIRDVQERGSDDEHVISRVLFALEIGGRFYPSVTTDVTQRVGEHCEAGPLEIARPRGYTGPLNYAAFCEAVERYLRSVPGATGTAFRAKPDPWGLVRPEVVFTGEVVDRFEFEAEPPAAR